MTDNNKSKDNDGVEVNHEKFKDTQAQLEDIQNDIRKEQPLTSALKPLEDLRSKYEAGSNFDKGVLILANDYSGVRSIRGDGNCYYRAFLYSLCEKLFQAEADEKNRIKAFVQTSAATTEKAGYDATAIEIFHETLVDLIVSVVDGTTTQDKIHEELLEENATSDYCTWYCRVLTGTQLKSDPDRFFPYLEDGSRDVFSFCSKSVEPMGVECTMVQVLALAEIFRVQVKIEYLDGHDIAASGKLQQHQFGPENSKTSLTLLYRPGHYDILYPK